MIIPSDNNDSPKLLTDLMKEMENIDNFTVEIERMIELSEKSREHPSRSLKKYSITPNDFKKGYSNIKI